MRAIDVRPGDIVDGRVVVLVEQARAGVLLFADDGLIGDFQYDDEVQP